MNITTITTKAPFLLMSFLALLTHTVGHADMQSALVGHVIGTTKSETPQIPSLEGKLQPIADRLDRLADRYLELEEASPQLARVTLAGAVILAKTTISATIGAVAGGAAGAATGAGVGALNGIATEVLGSIAHAIAGEKIEDIFDHGINELSPLLMEVDHTLTPEGARTLGTWIIATSLSSGKFSRSLGRIKKSIASPADISLEKVAGALFNPVARTRSLTEREFRHTALHEALEDPNSADAIPTTAAPTETWDHTPASTASPDGYFYDPALYRDLWNKDSKAMQDAIERPFYSQLERSFSDYLSTGTLPPENPYEAYRSLWNTQLENTQEAGPHESQESHPFYSQLKDSFRDYVNGGTLPRESFFETYRPLWNSEFTDRQTLTSAPFHQDIDTFRDALDEKPSRNSGYYNPLNDPSVMKDAQAFWDSYQEKRPR